MECTGTYCGGRQGAAAHTRCMRACPTAAIACAEGRHGRKASGAYGLAPGPHSRWEPACSAAHCALYTKERSQSTARPALQSKCRGHDLPALALPPPPSCAQHLANVFIDTARMSPHKPQSHEEELAMLIYSTAPVFSARFEVQDAENYDGPDITYYFDQQDKWVVAIGVGASTKEHGGADCSGCCGGTSRAVVALGSRAHQHGSAVRSGQGLAGAVM